MKKLFTRVIGAGAVALVSLMPIATHAAASPAQHEEFSVVGDVFECEENDYTITSGTVRFVFHFDETPSGNANVTGTSTPQHVVALGSDGKLYNIRGAVWFGGTFNANTESGQETFTGKLQIVKQKGGGTTDSVNVTFHMSPNGDVKVFDFGSCAF